MAPVAFKAEFWGWSWGAYVEGESEMPPAPWAALESDGSAVAVQIDRLVVRCPDSQAWLYGVRDADGGFRIALHGVDLCASAEEASRALGGLGPMKAWMKRGRPTDSGLLAALTLEQYQAAYEKLAQEHRDLGHARPKMYELADELALSKDTVRRFRRSHGLPWPPNS